MKKQLLLTFIIALIIPFSQSKADCRLNFYIVSDFDDTIKTYGSDFALARLGNALFRRKINSGMDALFQELVNESKKNVSSNCASKKNFTVLTASPKILTYSIKRLLKKRNFTNYELITRPLREKTLPYKVDRVTKLSEREGVPLILIGDDTSHDAHAYYQFQEENPGKALQVYIHNVRNNPQLPGHLNYITSFEIALNELDNERLSIESVIHVGETLLAGKDKEIVPPYGHCPSEYNLADSGFEEIDLLAEEIEQRVESICESRSLK